MQSDRINILEDVDFELVRANGSVLTSKGKALADFLGPKGKFQCEHYDKNGNLIGVYDLPNQVTNQGKNSWLGIMFHADTQITAWYIGLVDNSGFTSFNVADTMASHTGWVEFQSYSGAARVAWGPAASSGNSITNTVAAVFNITAAGTLQGIFVTSSNTLGGTVGTLWTGASFAATVAVNNGDQLKITYTVNS